MGYESIRYSCHQYQSTTSFLKINIGFIWKSCVYIISNGGEREWNRMIYESRSWNRVYKQAQHFKINIYKYIQTCGLSVFIGSAFGYMLRLQLSTLDGVQDVMYRYCTRLAEDLNNMYEVKSRKAQTDSRS